MDERVLWTSRSNTFGGKMMKPATVAKVTDDLLYFETEGVLQSDGQQIPLAYVYDVDVKQDFLQKRRGIGTLTMHVRRPEGIEEVVTMEDMVDYRTGCSVINEAAKQARLRERQSTQTHYYSGGQPATPHFAPPVGSSNTSQDDYMAQLRRLKDMHEAGLLNDEEYATKRAAILDRL